MTLHARPSRRRDKHRWLSAAAWSVLIAILTVLAAPLWHDHGHASTKHRGVMQSTDGGDQSRSQQPAPIDDDEGCSICTAVSTPTGDGLPTLPLLQLPDPCAHERRLGSERAAVLWVGLDRASRGPPLTALS